MVGGNLEGLHWKQMLQNRMASSSARISPMTLPSHRKVRSTTLSRVWENQNIWWTALITLIMEPFLFKYSMLKDPTI